MRRSRSALPLLAAPLLVLGACAGLAPALAATGQASAHAQASAAAAASFPAHYAAPYLQITSGDAGDMAADLSASGDSSYTLAFLIPQSGCTPEWEDNGDSVGAFTSQVNSLKSAGGNVIISFGGESGGELAQTCTSVSSLTAAYANVVNTYGVNRLDFDIEGGHAGRHGLEQPPQPGPGRAPGAEPVGPGRLHARGGPERAALRGAGRAAERADPTA